MADSKRADKLPVRKRQSSTNSSNNSTTSTYAIGIDLGTTYSCVAVYRDGAVEIIPNEAGNHTTPSMIAFTDRGKLVGEAAKLQASDNAVNTIFDNKRLIGRRLDDAALKHDLSTWPFVVSAQKADSNNNSTAAEIDKTIPYVTVTERGVVKQYSSTQISSFVLAKCKFIAESYLQCEVTDAVITVPAYFNDAQRQATRDAGTIAGLNVLRIINEPTAAALAYGLQQQQQQQTIHDNAALLHSLDLSDDSAAAAAAMNELQQQALVNSRGLGMILIFDLGGGTFDVSLLQHIINTATQETTYEVMATAGDTHLGGEDFDQLLMDYCLQQFALQHAVKTTTDSTAAAMSSDDSMVHVDQRALRRLRTACEAGKRMLSAVNSVRIEIDAFLQLPTTAATAAAAATATALDLTITRTTFESLCMPLFTRCMLPVEKVLRDAKINKNLVSDVVLVGGSTRIPCVQHMIYSHFDNHKHNSNNSSSNSSSSGGGASSLYVDVDVDESVAYGAAVQAAILTHNYANNNNSNNKSKSNDSSNDNTSITASLASLTHSNNNRKNNSNSNSNSNSNNNSILLIDVIPLSLGIETAGGMFETILQRNTTTPTTTTRLFTTVVDYQDYVSVKVYEGERVKTCDNHFLGEFVHDVSAASVRNNKAGESVVVITFAVDADGILCVTATDQDKETAGKNNNSNNSSNQTQITINRNSLKLSAVSIQQMYKDAETFRAQDKQQQATIVALLQLQSYAGAVELVISEHRHEFEANDAAVAAAKSGIEETKLWLAQRQQDSSSSSDSDSHETMSLYITRQQQLEAVCLPLLTACLKDSELDELLQTQQQAQLYEQQQERQAAGGIRVHAGTQVIRLA